MHHANIPSIGAASAWRKDARSFLSAGVPPDQILWGDYASSPDLFTTQTKLAPRGQVSVPQSFVTLAQTVVWHSDPERFARLYAFLWRLKDDPHLMSDRGDTDLSRLRQMERNVRRCQHKMKAFVRFREIGTSHTGRRSFAAWFEPTHNTVEPTADFFVRRFSDMDWRILTPDVSAIFENGTLSFQEGHLKPDLPADAGEQLWITYFRNIFNPARLKVKAMQSEMPKKYWENMPEAAAIPDMIAGAPARARSMAEAAPTLPPARMSQVQAQLSNCNSAWDGPREALPAAISACTRCPLHRTATQAVAGEGPSNATLMIVGEQPGDDEDLCGRPFVGPAGKVFDAIASEVGLNRSDAYVTNAVKHFKFTTRGRRRIHQRPVSSEIDHCRGWLDAEIDQINPKLILAMGASATESLTGSGKDILSRRGGVETSRSGLPVLITLHPSYLLRVSDPKARLRSHALFREDLSKAVGFLT
jgi:uracil-DNA glycosylase